MDKKIKATQKLVKKVNDHLSSMLKDDKKTYKKLEKCDKLKKKK